MAFSSLTGLDRAEIQLGLALARYLRSAPLYPESNPKVQAALTELWRVGQEAWGVPEGFSLVLAGDQLSIQGQACLLDHPELAWLAKAFTEARLQGLTLGPGLAPDQLALLAKAVTERRQRCRQGLDPWTLEQQELQGVQLLQGDLQPEVDPGSRAASGGGRGAGPAPALAGLAALLLASEDLEERLQALGQALPGKVAPPDLLKEVLAFLPGEALDSPATCVGLVVQVLEAALATCQAHRAQAGPADSRLLRKILAAVAERLFAPKVELLPVTATVTAEGADPLAEPPPPGRLKEAWNRLPALPLRLDPLAGCQAEALAADLFLFLHAVEESQSRRLQVRLGDRLKAAGPEELAAIGAALKECFAAAPSPERERCLGRLLDLLKEADRASLALETGAFTAEAVRITFPRLFGFFLEALDPGRPEQARILVQVCQELGPREILAESAFLAGAAGIVQARLASKILAVPSRALVPLVLLILRARGTHHHREAIEFLARAGLETPAALVFWFYESPDLLALQPLLWICEAELTGRARPELEGFVARLLMRFVDEAAGDPLRGYRRAEAVKGLARFPSPETERFLQGLTKGGLLRLRREDAEVREAARQALASIRGGGRP